MAYSHATGEDACTTAIEYCLEVAAAMDANAGSLAPPLPVLDLFCGYGSTLAVANAHGLPAYGMDVSLKCCAKSAEHRASDQLLQALGAPE